MAPSPPSWPQFGAWALCGASAALILLGAFTVGPFAVLPAAAFAVLALRLGGANVSAIGALAGVTAWALVLAWLDRGVAPYPLLAVGLVGPAVSLAVFRLSRRAVRRSPT